MTWSAVAEMLTEDRDPMLGGREQVAIACERQPDLIIMDVQLRVLGWYEVTRRLKGDPELRDIPVVAVTSTLFRATRKQAARPAATAISPSRFSPNQLLGMVRGFLEN